MRYEIIADTSIVVDLHNGYSILAMSRWDKEKRLYNTTLFIKKNEIDRYDLIDLTLRVETDNKKNYVWKFLSILKILILLITLIAQNMSLNVLSEEMPYMKEKD